MIRMNSSITFYKTLQMGWLAITLSYTEFMTSRRYTKIVKFIVDIHNSLKFFFLLLPSAQTNLSIGGLWVVHLVSQQCHTNPSLWTIYNINHLVNKLQLLLHVFGQCRLKNWRQILFIEKVVCCNN